MKIAEMEAVVNYKQKSKNLEKKIEEKIKAQTEKLQKELSDQKDRTKRLEDQIRSYMLDKNIHIMKRFSYWIINSKKEEVSYVSLPYELSNLYYEFEGGNENEIHDVMLDVISKLEEELNKVDNTIFLHNIKKVFGEKEESAFDKLDEKMRKELTGYMEATIILNSEGIRFD